MIGRKFDYSLKVVAVGESGVGKTCLLIRFVRDQFDDNSQSTLGVEFMSKIIQTEKNRIQLQLWDTAGQELFRSVTRGYYRGSAGALILFDLANRDSFENVEKWLQDIRDVAREDVVIVLIGNKADLAAKRQVSREEAEEFARKCNMSYYEVSAKTGENVQQAISSCVEQIEKNLITTDFQPNVTDSINFKDDEPAKGCC